MISIDRFEEILSDLAEEIPQSFYEELNGGIVVEPGYLLHPEDRNGTLYVMRSESTRLNSSHRT